MSMSMERSKADTIDYSPSTTLWEDNINKHNMVIFYKTWKKFNEIQITENKMDLNKSKMKNINA